VRELHNTLLRASIWASGDKITNQDVAESLAVTVAPKAETILGRSLEQGISLPEIIADVARHYLRERYGTNARQQIRGCSPVGCGQLSDP
jgi:DNA-binding NtrC family response regulator